MATNKYCNLPGTSKINATFADINTGFAGVEVDMNAEIAAREQTDADVTALDSRVDTIIQGGGPDKDAELVDIRTPDASYTPERTINVAGDVTRDMQAQFVSHKADYTQFKEEVDDKLLDRHQTPLQQYGTNQVYIDFPGTTYNVAGDAAFADDRDGTTGKLWMFYYQSESPGLVRREMPYVGCSPSELGSPTYATVMGTTRANHFVRVDGVWYCGAGACRVYKFTNGIDQEPELISTVSAVGSNGDQSFVGNLCVDRDDSNIWHAWYATFDGTNNGIRHATANSPSGPWTIESGFWLTPSAIDASLTWLRIYKVIEDKWGRLWSVAGAGRNWGDTEQPDEDDWAGVWMSPVDSLTVKPTAWQCVVQPPYFKAAPYGSPLVNNAYAPAFIQDGDDWYLYVNTGVYGTERIIELRPNLSDAWQEQPSDSMDTTLTSSFVSVDSTLAFIRDGCFKVTVIATALNFNASAQRHNVRIRLINAKSSEILSSAVVENGATAWESRAIPPVSAIINAKGGYWIQAQVSYQVGSGQTAPTNGRLRGISLAVERLY